MICSLSFDLTKDKGRPNSRRGVPSIWRRAKSAHLARGSRCRFITVLKHARPWALAARPCGAHPCFRDCTPSREQRHVLARGIMDGRRGLRETRSGNRLVQCKSRPRSSRLAAAQRPMRCGRLPFGGHRWWRPITCGILLPFLSAIGWCGWGGCQFFDLRYLNPIGSAWLGRFFRPVVELGSVWVCWPIPFSFF
jgi:hypothetical protein